MRIFQITNLGVKLARSIRNPETAMSKMIYYLDVRGSATLDQIVSYTGMDGGTVSSALRRLGKMGAVKEV